MFTDTGLLLSRLIFIGLIVEAFEILRLRQSFADGGMFSRSTLAIMTSGTRRQVRIGATLGASTAISVAMVVQLLAAVTVIAVGLGVRVGILAALICLTTNAFLRARRQIGSSGAEQLTFIVLVTFGLVIAAGGSEEARRLGDGFIAAQVILAYVASGVSKAVSPVWRDGQALSRIMSAEGYGIPGIAALLLARPWIDKLLCWSVIAWEISFPLVLIAPRPLMIALLLAGVIFHISCAVLMGLNRFVWAFCGCYPAVWATTMLLR